MYDVKIGEEMGKDPEKINPKIAEHLIRLLQENKIKGYELAERIEVTPANVSNWKTGKQGMTAYNAKRIHEAFPLYSIEYILGESDYKNEQEQYVFEQGEKLKKWAESTKAAETLIELNGIYTSFDIASDVFTFRKEGRELSITRHQFEAFADEVQAYVNFRMTAMFERGEW